MGGNEIAHVDKLGGILRHLHDDPSVVTKAHTWQPRGRVGKVLFGAACICC
jgi:hypothetical protein